MAGGWLVSYVVLWLLLVAMATILLSVLHNLGVLYAAVSKVTTGRQDMKPSTLVDGEVLPDVECLTEAGKPVNVSDFAGSKVAFAVVSAACGACARFLEVALHDGPDPLDRDLRRMVIVSLSDPAATSTLLARAGVQAPSGQVLYDRDEGLSRRWGVRMTPGMIIANEDLRLVRQVFGSGGTPVGHSHPDATRLTAALD